MIQQFIELGQGYGDVFELCELLKTNEQRIHHAFMFISNKNEKTYASLAVAFKPVGESKFMPIYICREGIPYDENKKSKRVEIFETAVTQYGHQINRLETKHSSIFSEVNLYYQYLIGILRLNHYIPPMH